VISPQPARRAGQPSRRAGHSRRSPRNALPTDRGDPDRSDRRGSDRRDLPPKSALVPLAAARPQMNLQCQMRNEPAWGSLRAY